MIPIPYAAVDALRSIRRTLDIPEPEPGARGAVSAARRLVAFALRQSAMVPETGTPGGNVRREGAYGVDTQPGA